MAWLMTWARLALGMSALTWLLILALIAASGLAPRRQIAFTVTLARNSEIYTLDLNTGVARNLTRHSAVDDFFAWSPDGSWIVFVSDRDFNRDLFLMDSSGGSLRQLTHADTDSLYPVWSPDGRAIAYVFDVSVSDANQDIMVLDAATGAARNLTTHPGSDQFPVWSPDSRHIAFISDRNDPGGPNAQTEVFVVDIDGANLRQISHEGARVESAIWSPDGQAIIFSVIRPNRMTEMFAVDVETGERSPLAGSQALLPAWSPDGRQLAFSGYLNGNQDLFLMDAAGTSAIRITSSPRDDVSPAWSPDGRQLAFISYADYSVISPRGGVVLMPFPQMFIMDVNADGWIPALVSGFGAAYIAWRPGLG